jgi:hypothetical protein
MANSSHLSVEHHRHSAETCGSGAIAPVCKNTAIAKVIDEWLAED